MSASRTWFFVILGLWFATGCKSDSTDTGWDSQDGEACLSCHVGVEDVHPGAVEYGQCTVCHGGDGSALLTSCQCCLWTAPFIDPTGTAMEQLRPLIEIALGIEVYLN